MLLNFLQKFIILNFEKNIEDENQNVTSFLIMSKNINQPEYEKNKKYITAVYLDLKVFMQHLYKCLGGFATNQVNLNKIRKFFSKKYF